MVGTEVVEAATEVAVGEVVGIMEARGYDGDRGGGGGYGGGGYGGRRFF